MPDSVRCNTDSSNTFTCEVDIGPEPTPSVSSSTASTASTSAPTVPAPPANPAVSALVSSYARDVIAPVKPPLAELVTRLGENCGSAETGVLLLAGAKLGALGVLAGFKAGFDLGKCIATEKYGLEHEDTMKAAAADCAASGGVVTFVNGDSVMCNVTGSGR